MNGDGRRGNGLAPMVPPRQRTADAGQPGSVADEDSPAQQARVRIMEETPALVEAAIERAKDGSCPHLKFLFELAGWYPLPAPVEARSDPRSLLAADLMRRLEGAGGESP